MLKLRWLGDRLIFNMGIPILVGRHLCIEMPQIWQANLLVIKGYLCNLSTVQSHGTSFVKLHLHETNGANHTKRSSIRFFQVFFIQFCEFKLHFYLCPCHDVGKLVVQSNLSWWILLQKHQNLFAFSNTFSNSSHGTELFGRNILVSTSEELIVLRLSLIVYRHHITEDITDLIPTVIN